MVDNSALLGSLVLEMTNSFMEMERLKPGSFEVLMSRMLQRLARSKEPSVKDLQDLATHVFTKGKTVAEQTSKLNAETDSRKKQQNKEANQNSNLSPLARFLLSRGTYLIYAPDDPASKALLCQSISISDQIIMVKFEHQGIADQCIVI
ncbi:hypothetical protein POM88_045318 [Heracleum sosnowskyi]|uniref:Uncharacterized protein n=1 Tax=Heracleum sosnowskyi TaxID=360622 RepID=A0AAD8M5Y2_9APIA|nr:hypothetical protein POM88_045318 [Heracleum sosnowskyi]